MGQTHLDQAELRELDDRSAEEFYEALPLEHFMVSIPHRTCLMSVNQTTWPPVLRWTSQELPPGR